MLQIAAENVESLSQEKFNFKPEKILNKALIFNTSRIDKEKMKTKNKVLQEAKSIFEKLKTDEKMCRFPKKSLT